MMSRIISKNVLDNFCFDGRFCFRFFKTLDWQDVYYKQLKPPIVPKVESEGDTRNFENYQDADLKQCPPVSIRQIQQFADF